MGVTKVDKLDSTSASANIGNSLPTTPALYYGINSNDVDSVTWHGGELYFNTGDNRLYIQVTTSGVTPTWKRLLETFATSTTSSSSTSSSSTSTSTSSSTTSSTTSSSTTTE